MKALHHLFLLCGAILLPACGGSSDSSSTPAQNHAPVINSNSDVSTDNPEQFSHIIDATDADNDTLTFTIVGGDDAEFFSLDDSRDELIFLSPPAYEVPQDKDKNNVYQLQVGAFDGTVTTKQHISVAVLSNLPPSINIQYPPKVASTAHHQVWIRGNTEQFEKVNSLMINGEPVISNDDFKTWQVRAELINGDNTFTLESLDINGKQNASTEITVNYDTQMLPFPDDSITVEQPYTLDLDNSNTHLYFIDHTADAIYQLELSTGKRRLIADTSDPDNKYDFRNLFGLVVDDSRGRLIVSTSYSELFSIDIKSGDQSLLLDMGAEYNYLDAYDIAIDGNDEMLYFIDYGTKDFWSLNLNTSALDTIYYANVPVGVNPNKSPHTYWLAVDDVNQRLVTVQKGYQGSLHSFDLEPLSSELELISGPSMPDQNNVMTWQKFVSLDGKNNAIVIDDYTNSLLRINLETGVREVLSSETLPHGENLLSQPFGLAVDEHNQIAYVSDASDDIILAIDLLTGDRVVISR